MAKCKSCGKKGLFFKVNADGLCSYCAPIVAEDKRLAEIQRQEREAAEREKSRQELEDKIRAEMQQEMEYLKVLNQQKAEQSVSTINLTDADYSGYPDIEINQNNRYLLKTLVDKYTTKEIDDNFVKWYEFESAFTPHEYSDREILEKSKYIVYNMLNKMGSLKYWVDSVNDHKKWFDYYDNLIQLLPQLSEFEPYVNFILPLPHDLYKKYIDEREQYTNAFIERWWQRVINQAASLKTIDGRKNKIDNFYKELMTYREFISDNNLQLVDKLKAETDLETIKKTEKPLPEFDSQKEQELLSVLKNSIGNSLNEHFAYIELQNFYYKYRKNDQKYLELCKEYCQKDIVILPQVDKNYIIKQTQTLERLMSYSSRADYKKDLERVQKCGFEGRIPAFKRMSIICENEKDFDGAISYCDMEIKHLISHGIRKDSVSLDEVYKRREKLLAKRDKLLNEIKK